MTEARIKRPEAEGAFFSMAKISFRNTSGLTKVPMSSEALMHCKKEGKMQSSGNMATARLPLVTVLTHRASHLWEGMIYRTYGEAYIHPHFSHGGDQGKWDPGL